MTRGFDCHSTFHLSKPTRRLSLSLSNSKVSVPFTPFIPFTSTLPKIRQGKVLTQLFGRYNLFFPLPRFLFNFIANLVNFDYIRYIRY